MVQDDAGNYIVIGQTTGMGNGGEDVLLVKLDTEGRELWSKTYGAGLDDKGRSLTIAKNGDYILTGETKSVIDNSTNVYLIRTDENGNLLWEKSFGGPDTDIGQAVIETSTGDIVVVGENRSDALPSPTSPNFRSPDIYFIKTDASGEILLEETYGNIEQDRGLDVVETPEGNFALTGVTGNESDLLLLMLSANGEELWSNSFGGIFTEEGRSIALTADGGFVVAGVKEITPITTQAYLIKTDAQGNFVWDRLFGSNGLDAANSVALVPDGGFILAGNFDINNAPNRPSTFAINDFYLIRTNGVGNVFRNTINGTIHRDINTNCERDNNEEVLEDWLVRVRRGNEVFYATTDEQGNYSLSVENGNYNVGLVVLNEAWEVCQNYNVAFTGSDTMQLDFAVRSTVEDCPVLIVDVSTAILEPCREAIYSINLCNRGISTAEETYVDVQMDPFLEVNYSSLPWTNRVGNTFRFDVGDLRIEECGSFTVNATLSCEAAVGQAHCVEAYAHPDAICIPPPPLWDGASIVVDGECTGDSVQFIIRNVGGGNMGTPLGFVVIQDNIIFRQSSGNFQLPSGGADTIFIPTTNDVSSYRIVTEQPAGHPYGTNASTAVEGCPFGQPFRTGNLTVFSDADALPFFSVDCQENKLITGNALMTASPKGLGNTNDIVITDELEYHIYFQNTGSDTVNQLVIRDTISPYLDITTLVPGASSHDYDYSINGQGVLKFTFRDINLLSENVNAAESFGFVKFKIAQRRDNQVGMVIRNQATILFDFGVPILSNPTFHTIGGETVEEFVEVITDVETVFVPDVEVKIMPNPFDNAQGTMIEIVGMEGLQAINFDLYDVAGQLVQQQQFNSHQFQFHPNNLPQGLYIYNIRTEGKLVNVGKVFIK